MNTPIRLTLLASLLGSLLLSPLSHAVTTQPDPKATTQGVSKPLTLIDLSELQQDGAAVLVLSFNQPLDDKQDFRRVVQLNDEERGKIDGGWELAKNGKSLRFRHPEPDRKLVINLEPELASASGQLLGKRESKKITTRDIKPMVGFASRGSLLPVQVAQGLPVYALNVDKIDVDFFRVKRSVLPAFLAEWNNGSNLSIWDSKDLLKNTELAWSGRFDLHPARNTRERLQLPLVDADALREPGVYLAVMKEAGSYNYSQPATLFTLSDIGLSLHRFPNQSDIFTQSLESGDPLAKVKVQLLDEKGAVLSEGSTDRQGHLTLPAQPKARLLLAMQDDQASMIELNKPALDLAEFPVAGAQGYDKQLYVFGPRDLYRPGETVLVNALLRDADGKPLPPQPVRAEVVQPDGEVTRTFVWQPQDGFYQQQFALPANAMTGDWTLRLNTGDNLARSWRFHVEDFMPERMALTLQADAAPLSVEDSVIFNVEGRYLYGAPAAGNALQGQLFLRPARDAVSTLPGYQFGDITEEGLKRSLDEVDTQLNAEGEASIEVNSEWAKAHSPLNLILQASLLETGGRPVTRRVTQAIWPAPALPGIRPLFASKATYDWRTDRYRDEPTVEENSVAEFDVVYANNQGEKLAAESLDVRLVRERRDYYWSFSNSEGWQSRYDEKDLVEEEQSLSIAAGGSQKVSFPVEWGSYRLEVQADEKIVSSVRFQAGYSWQDNTNGTGALRPDQVKLKLDKASYQPGDTARVQVEAPAAGSGYLMVESSSGPIWWQPVTIPAGGTTIEVPINREWHRHDLYLSALVVREGDRKTGATPKRAVGLLHLQMASESRRLALTLEAPAKVRPDQNVAVKVKASRVGGELPKQITVLLSAVDSGILNITDYRTPDPWEGFFGRKRYSADQYDVYGQLIEGGGRLAALRFGGDADDDSLMRGGKKPETHVQIVAQQLQPVQLDENGEGTLNLMLPAFNGELRLMAQSWSADTFGSAERKIVVAAPLVMQMSTPRFMAGGDRAELALDLSNLTDSAQTLTVAPTSAGLVTLVSTATQTVTLAKGARSTLKLPVTASNGFGDGEIAVTVSGLSLPGETAGDSHQQWKIGVRPAYPAQTLSFDAVIKQGEPWQVPAAALIGLQRDTLMGKLALSNRPPLNVGRFISELYAYPYGCLEQTTSGIWPSVFTNQQQLAAMGIKTSSDEQRREAVNTGIARLAGMQRHDGSFGLWSKQSHEEYWLTAYVTDFMLNAADAGYALPDGVVSRASARLLRYLQDPAQIERGYTDNSDAQRFSVQAYAGLVLARQQQAPLGALRALYEKRERSQSGLALVQLGVALQLMGDAQRAQVVVAEGAAFERKGTVWIGDYGSPVRDKAMMIALLNANNMLPEVQNQLLFDLAKEVRSKRYLSTQENNALFQAGRTLQGPQSLSWQAELNSLPEPLTANKPLNSGLDSHQLQQGVVVSTQNASPLYGSLDVVGYPDKAPQPASKVLNIKREYLHLDGSPVGAQGLESGELVLVRLTVSASQRVNDALVVDLLPAGIELENQNLGDSSASLGESADALKESMMDMQQVDIKHIEFRDDRFVAAITVGAYRPSTLLYLARAVTPGTYRMPAPLVESMYAPEWRATGATPDALNVR